MNSRRNVVKILRIRRKTPNDQLINLKNKGFGS